MAAERVTSSLGGPGTGQALACRVRAQPRAGVAGLAEPLPTPPPPTARLHALGTSGLGGQGCGRVSGRRGGFAGETQEEQAASDPRKASFPTTHLGSSLSHEKAAVGRCGRSRQITGNNRSVGKACPTLCSPMDCSLPGFPLLHYFPEFAQTHV